MKLLSTIALATVASVTALAAPQTQEFPEDKWPVPEEFLPEIKCETSKASPYNEDIALAIEQLRQMDDDLCRNTNHVKSHCTTVFSKGSAAVGVCGPSPVIFKADNYIPCFKVGRLR